MKGDITQDTAIEIWYSGPESDQAKRTLFDEAIHQGRIVVHWESFQDEEDDDGTD
jgi:hypothetical protein